MQQLNAGLQGATGKLVGRDSELEQLKSAVLGDHKRTVVMGGPGEGKTRLALQLAECEEFVGAGTFFLDLSGVLGRCSMPRSLSNLTSAAPV